MENISKIKSYNRIWAQNNREKMNAYQRKYYENNKEKVKQINKKYIENNRDKWSTYQKEYQQKESYKNYRKNYEAEYRKNNKIYNNFRSAKSRLFKIHGEELGSLYLAAYVMKMKITKNIDMSLFLSKKNRSIHEDTI